MPAFGVHSETGKLRKVIVHRPELSLQRLTPFPALNWARAAAAGTA